MDALENRVKEESMHKNYQNSYRVPVKAIIKWFGYFQLFEVPNEISKFLERLREIISSINFPQLDEHGFYMLLTGIPIDMQKIDIGELLYIGQTCEQTLRQRIPQNHPSYECIVRKYHGHMLYLAVGHMEVEGINRKTCDLFDDIECCLIYDNKPVCNTSCTDEYLGRRVVYIQNTDQFRPLHEISRCPNHH